MVMSMSTNTNNPSFSKCFFAILPFMRVCVQDRLFSCSEHLEEISKKAPALSLLSIASIAGPFSFLRHPQSIAFDMLTCGTYYAQFPQHLSRFYKVLNRSLEHNRHTLYYLRSTAIAFLISVKVRQDVDSTRHNLHDTLKSIFYPTGDGFCN
jgi:hypothetical protein